MGINQTGCGVQRGVRLQRAELTVGEPRLRCLPHEILVCSLAREKNQRERPPIRREMCIKYLNGVIGGRTRRGAQAPRDGLLPESFNWNEGRSRSRTWGRRVTSPTSAFGVVVFALRNEKRTVSASTRKSGKHCEVARYFSKCQTVASIADYINGN